MTTGAERQGMLLLDTCGDGATLALAEVLEAGAAVAVRGERLIEGRRSSEALLPALRAALAEAGWTARDLRVIGVVRGPGSFTGVRVGLSAAKGLSEGLGVPIVAPTRFAVMAAAAESAEWDVAVLRAGREEFFWARASGEAMGVDAVTTLRERLRAEKLAVLCQAGDAEEFAGLRVLPMPELRAGMAAGLVTERWSRGEVDDATLLDALYLRRTEQELLDRQRRHREERAGL